MFVVLLHECVLNTAAGQEILSPMRDRPIHYRKLLLSINAPQRLFVYYHTISVEGLQEIAKKFSNNNPDFCHRITNVDEKESLVIK